MDRTGKWECLGLQGNGAHETAPFTWPTACIRTGNGAKLFCQRSPQNQLFQRCKLMQTATCVCLVTVAFSHYWLCFDRDLELKSVPLPQSVRLTCECGESGTPTWTETDARPLFYCCSFSLSCANLDLVSAVVIGFIVVCCCGVAAAGWARGFAPTLDLRAHSSRGPLHP